MKKSRRLLGSFTIEALCIMAFIFMSIAVVIHEAGRIHDQSAGAMALHEVVEKSRHEKRIDREELESSEKYQPALLLCFPSYDMDIHVSGKSHLGTGQGGDWQKQIQMKEFRPEAFLRKISVILSQ